MVNSSCANPTLANPQLAVCLKTTALDYQQFLFRTLTYSVLPKKLVDASEIDYTPFMSDSYTLYGTREAVSLVHAEAGDLTLPLLLRCLRAQAIMASAIFSNVSTASTASHPPAAKPPSTSTRARSASTR
eukprot:scaffold13386_cov214-Isochrysis_galbana.AAC.4